MILERLRGSDFMEGPAISPASQQHDGGEGSSTVYQSIGDTTLFSFSLDILPNETTTSLVIKSFFEFVNPVFYITTPERCADLMNNIYHNDNEPTIADICELYAIAAAGCQYEDTVTETVSSSFEFISSQTLLGKSGPRDLQGMKCCLGLSQYWEIRDISKAKCLIGQFQEKFWVISPRLSNHLIAYAAELAGQCIPSISSDISQVIEWVHWAKVFRTIKMLQW
jgi:hypothetical protein